MTRANVQITHFLLVVTIPLPAPQWWPQTRSIRTCMWSGLMPIQIFTPISPRCLATNTEHHSLFALG
jgi:hypothetical protein